MILQQNIQQSTIKMNTINLYLLLITTVATGVTSSQNCRYCPYTHPQDIFCRSGFVGHVKINEVVTDAENDSLQNTDNDVAAIITIIKIYKGKYEDFEVGSTVYLFAPTEKDCKREYWKDDVLISGRPFRGGLLTTTCDKLEAISHFKEKQLKVIQGHFHEGTYARGCPLCHIKGPYDHSTLRVNECRHKYNEFPMTTTACVPTGNSGRCQILKDSTGRYKLPPQMVREEVPQSSSKRSLGPSFSDCSHTSNPAPQEPKERENPPNPKLTPTLKANKSSGTKQLILRLNWKGKTLPKTLLQRLTKQRH